MNGISYNNDFESFKWEDAPELAPKSGDNNQDAFMFGLLTKVLGDL